MTTPPSEQLYEEMTVRKKYMTFSCEGLKSPRGRDRTTRKITHDQNVLFLRCVARIPFILIHEAARRNWRSPGYCTCQPRVRRRSVLDPASWSRN